MVEESNLSKCSVCQEVKHRIQNGKYPDNINKRWQDDNGNLWVGRKCPECVKTSMKNRMQKFRLKKEAVNV